MKVILASMSPRRKELLEQIDVTFEIMPAMGEEKTTKTIPNEVVMELSKQKALLVYEEAEQKYKKEEFLVLGADTVVSYDNKIIGKPKDEVEAFETLKMLSGKEHFVYTGVTIVLNTKEVYTFYEETMVKMYPMSEKEIKAYIKTKEPMDKAGTYGIQGKGAVFVEKIYGDYNNVVGLPVSRLVQKMLKLGIDIFHIS